MKLKDSADINSFLDTAKQCTGDIFFQTTEGDILNLKSLLSRYVMMSIMGNPSLLASSQVTCVQEEDYKLLAAYLEPYEES